MLFVRAARRAAWVALFTASACASDAHESPCGGDRACTGNDPSPKPDNVWREVACHEPEFQSFEVQDMQLAREVDYLLVQQIWGGSSSQERGERCATAADQPGCEKKLNALLRQASAEFENESCEGACGRGLSVFTTSGDDVRRWREPSEWRALLGPIDTVGESLLWAAGVHTLGMPCGDIHQGAVRQSAEGTLLRRLESSGDCDVEVESWVTYLSSPDGTLEIVDEEVLSSRPAECSVGRRPPGLASEGTAQAGAMLGRFFAKLAHLEAASVPAFEILEGELLALGAPSSLIRKVREAIADERVHARDMGALARRFGAEVPPVQVEPAPLREVFALALDNAVEGCVRETFGAALATYQALHARDEQVRALMSRIAEDETRHSGLAFQLAAWLEPQLTVDQRALVRAAQAEAIRQLREDLLTPLPYELVTVAGMPHVRAARHLLAELERQLLAPLMAA